MSGQRMIVLPPTLLVEENKHAVAPRDASVSPAHGSSRRWLREGYTCASGLPWGTDTARFYQLQLAFAQGCVVSNDYPLRAREASQDPRFTYRCQMSAFGEATSEEPHNAFHVPDALLATSVGVRFSSNSVGVAVYVGAVEMPWAGGWLGGRFTKDDATLFYAPFGVAVGRLAPDFGLGETVVGAAGTRRQVPNPDSEHLGERACADRGVGARVGLRLMGDSPLDRRTIAFTFEVDIGTW